MGAYFAPKFGALAKDFGGVYDLFFAAHKLTVSPRWLHFHEPLGEGRSGRRKNRCHRLASEHGIVPFFRPPAQSASTSDQKHSQFSFSQ